MDRKAIANLAFSCLAFSIVGVVVVEMLMMFASTAQEWGELARWVHVPVFTLIVSILLFFRFHLHTGRQWLMWVVVAMRVVILALNFTNDLNFNFDRIDSIVRIPFLGALAFEMSADTLRAARLARELRESEMRLEFAADSRPRTVELGRARESHLGHAASWRTPSATRCWAGCLHRWRTRSVSRWPRFFTTPRRPKSC
jgi:hypothetical protein